MKINYARLHNPPRAFLTLLAHSRIVRNKAAEKVRGSHGGSGQGHQHSHTGGLPSPIGQTSVIAHAPPAAHDLRDIRPSYSINGILGIGAQDPNGNNIGKRKRDDGEWVGWLVGWLGGWLVGWLGGWLVGWLVGDGWLVG